jgi:hypothetical protein
MNDLSDMGCAFSCCRSPRVQQLASVQQVVFHHVEIDFANIRRAVTLNAPVSSQGRLLAVQFRTIAERATLPPPALTSPCQPVG